MKRYRRSSPPNFRRKFRQTTLIAIFCLAVLAGLGLSRRLDFNPGLLLPLATSPFLLLLRHKNLISLYLVILLGVGMGAARGTTYMQKLHQLQNLSGQEVTLIGTATTDAIYGTNYQLNFEMNDIRLADSGQPLVGNFRVSGFGLPMVYRGDTLLVKGKLHPTRGSRQARMSYTQISLIKKDHSWVNSLTRRFSTGMQNALPEPQASFALGLLVGQRSTLQQNILNQLTAVGLIHIVAVSGYNVTILSRAVARLRLRSRYQQLVLSLSLIGLFMLVTGFSASIVRAGLVSLLSLLAWFYGLRIRATVLITLVAAITGFYNPFYVWGDLGWYLSFLAFSGVLIVAPMLQARLFRNQPKFATIVLVETLSAELMTLPLILSYFNQLSLVAPLANLLVVPLVPLAMLLGTVAAVFGAVAPAVAGWFSWPAAVLLTYMLDIAHLLSSIPLSFVRVSAGAGVMVVFYVLVMMVGKAVQKSISRQNNSLNMVK